MNNRYTFLSEWFSGCKGNIEMQILPDGKQESFSVDNHQGIEAFAVRYNDKDVYFGAATRNGQGGTKANILNIPGVWTEIDFKSIPKQKADKLLAECPLQPTFIINYGDGYCAYWRFNKPTDNLEVSERIHRQLAQYFGSDPVHDVTRIFRLPDTFNHQYDPKRPVTVIQYNKGNRYSENDFEKRLSPLKSINSSGQTGNLSGRQKDVRDVGVTKKAPKVGNPLSKRLYDLKQAAIYLGRPVYSVRTLIWKGALPVIKDGRKLYLDIVDMDIYIEHSKERMA